MRYWIPLAALLLLVSCAEEPPHPNQQAVDRAEKLTDEAIDKAKKAEHELKQERRLRDIDRVKYEAEVTQAESEVYTWRLLLTVFSVLLVIVIVWLAREIRVRRILSHLWSASAGKEVKRE